MNCSDGLFISSFENTSICSLVYYFINITYNNWNKNLFSDFVQTKMKKSVLYCTNFYFLLLFTYYQRAHTVRVNQDNYMNKSVKINGGFPGAHGSILSHFAHLEILFEPIHFVGGKETISSCSAVVISDRYILTASHCMFSSKLQHAVCVLVCIGEKNRRDCPWKYRASSIYIPNNNKPDPDISIIRLSSSSGLSPLPLIKENNVGGLSPVYVSGAGRNQVEQDGKVKSIQITMYDSEICECLTHSLNRRHSCREKRIGKYILCGMGFRVSSIGNKYIYDCGVNYGDSGGPLYEIRNGNTYLLGITTAFFQFNDGERISFFANVPIVSQSIKNVLKTGRDPYWREISLSET